MQSQQVNKDVFVKKDEELIGITRALSNQEDMLGILLTVLQDLEKRMHTILRQDNENCSPDSQKNVSTDSILATMVHIHNEKIQYAIDVMTDLNRRLDV